jgi:outer membrane immunogenic protein
MKKFILGIAFAMIAGYSFSQSPLRDGRSQLNVGVGFSDIGTPFYVGVDVGVLPDVTLGGEFSYRNYRENWDNYYYDHNIMGFSGNGNYHFNRLLGISPRWDFYAGLNLGFYVWTSSDDYNGSNSSGLGLGAQVGGRCYLSNKVALNLEFGGGNAFSGGKLGLTVKL